MSIWQGSVCDAGSDMLHGDLIKTVTVVFNCPGSIVLTAVFIGCPARGREDIPGALWGSTSLGREKTKCRHFLGNNVN